MGEYQLFEVFDRAGVVRGEVVVGLIGGEGWGVVLGRPRGWVLELGWDEVVASFAGVVLFVDLEHAGVGDASAFVF